MAYTMPSKSLSSVERFCSPSSPINGLPSALIGNIFAFGATPEIPFALFPIAPIIPATCVPCPQLAVVSSSFPFSSYKVFSLVGNTSVVLCTVSIPGSFKLAFKSS